MARLVLWMLLGFLPACSSVPQGVEPVANFDAERYVGTWYEIARLDHRFERGLTQVRAEYSWRPDGQIRVLNLGFDASKQSWKSAEGRARFVQAPHIGHLEVSFWGPFYSSYVVFELDANYEYAFVSGPSHQYLWLLARTPQVPESVKQAFISRAQGAGFNTQALIWLEPPGGAQLSMRPQ